MKIINLKAENVKKIKAIDITPTDSTIIITGKNGQGKSSILDSILFALGGKDALKNTPKPVRDGEDHATVEIDLGEYKVIRSWNDKGTTRLEVFSKEGAKFGSPQSLLDEIVGRIAFDPLAFAQMKAVDQRAVLLDVLGLTDKVDELQEVYKEKFQERTLVGRDVKNAEGHVASIVVPENAPKEPVDTLKVSQELEKAQAHNSIITETEEGLAEAEEEVKELEQQLAETKKAVAAAKLALKGKKKVDVEPIREKLANAGKMNLDYEAVESLKKARKSLDQYKDTQKQLTDELNSITKQKEALITTAKLPIDGLSIDSDGVTFKEIPFSQLSSAEQLKVSLAIAMAMNPKLRVMRIMDGSLLDSDNMEVIKQMATAEDYQVWIERVEDSGQVGILIEDGEIKK